MKLGQVLFTDEQVDYLFWFFREFRLMLVDKDCVGSVNLDDCDADKGWIRELLREGK